MIRPGQTIGDVLDGVIQETLRTQLYQKSLEEKEKQTAGGDDIFGGGGEPTAPSPPTEPGQVDTTEAEPGEDDVQAMEQAPEIDDVIEKLNAVRSGRSLSDEDVAGAFEAYFNDLDEAEKVALFAFMKGIAQIVTGEVPGEQAVEPGEQPADVDMEKGSSTKNVTVKPTVVKKPAPVVGKKTSGETEDTTAPAPITPKKR